MQAGASYVGWNGTRSRLYSVQRLRSPLDVNVVPLSVVSFLSPPFWLLRIPPPSLRGSLSLRASLEGRETKWQFQSLSE
jgi:hypothetical protein